MSIGNSEYRALFENDFTRIEQMAGSNPSQYFIATDKTGVKYFFGQTENSCVLGPNGVFKWALSKIEDTNGNVVTFIYSRDNGQIYPSQIDYNGNQVKFYLEARDDKPDMYTPKFLVKTGKRLHLIDVLAADGGRIRTYRLTYRKSDSTGRSLLSSVDVFGKDAVVSADGAVTAPTSPQVQSFTYNPSRVSADPISWLDNAGMSGRFNQYVGDFNGDGKMDYMYIHDGWYVAPSKPVGDLLATIKNAAGGVTAISYTPSTKYNNTNLPFPVQTVSKVESDAGGLTEITYDGGYFYKQGRDFRGFNHVTVKGPVGPSGEQKITETWFHQGNDTAVDVNVPNVPTGYMKGRAYRTRVTDSSGKKYSETTTSYTQDSNHSVPYYFNPPLSVDSYTYDGDASFAHTQTTYAYDGYGNVVREDQYGDISDPADDRTIVRTFSPNISNWIVGLPASEDIYQGIGTVDKIAGKTYFYDDLTDCDGTPTNNQTPAYGKLTRIESWLSGGISPEVRMAYNSFGNLVCQRDAMGNVSSISYDTSNSYPTIVTNPLGHQSVIQYYGVDGVLADKGLYGQVKSKTDPNSAKTAMEYDVFGRKTKETLADGSWTSLPDRRKRKDNRLFV